MKALLLALTTGLLFLGLMTVVLRCVAVRRRAALLTALWAASMLPLALAYVLTPPSLGFLPPSLHDDPPWFGLPFCLGVWGVGYFGVALQLYNLAERGHSLRLLIDIAKAGACGLSIPEMAEGYAEGRGLGWMLDKRLAGLAAAGAIDADDGDVCIRPGARRTARRIRRLRALLRLSQWT
ncbi:MAG: hypothetical protein IT306_15075 [Chloroflexi bacterium]|nr:hypothetical protein [Chloroflexota bacterium]